MVKKGIKALGCSKRVAFKAIRDYFSKNSLTGDDISFLIAPLINSSGRMEDAIHSFKFLKSKNIDDAMLKLEYIVHLNNSRKEQEKSLFDASLKQVRDDENITIVWGEGWHEGVIGIVASRLSKRFKKPTIVFSIVDKIAKGSARSIGDVDILSLIGMQKDILLSFGGHKAAAGVSIEEKNLEEFKFCMVNAGRNIEAKEFEAGRDILGELDIFSVDFELLDILESHEPYGQKNPKPNFILKNALIKAGRVVGQDRRHLNLVLTKENTTIKSMFFNYDTDVQRGDTVSILFSIFRNEYRGLVTPQLLISQILHRS